jgi:predicted dehydrogenase
VSEPRPRIAVLGAGLIGRRHVAQIITESSVALHAVVDPTDAACAFAAEIGADWFPDMGAMLAAGRPDGMLIATPNQLHVEHGLQAIAAGVPVLVEKPLSDDAVSGETLVLAAERAGVALLTGHHRRHNPMIARAKAIIDSGRLGRIVTVHAFFWLMKPDDYFDLDWRRRRGAGPLLLNMIHDIDLLRHLCGEIESVQALQSSAMRGHDVDETTVVSLRFASGALGTVSVTDTVVAPWSWEHTTGENPAYPRTDEPCCMIGGTHGSLSLPRLEIWSNAGKRGWWEPFAVERAVAADEDPLRLQIRQFGKVIRGEEPPLVSGRDGLETLRVIHAIQRAADSGVMVGVGDGSQISRVNA